jgi:hypothetical protein
MPPSNLVTPKGSEFPSCDNIGIADCPPGKLCKPLQQLGKALGVCIPASLIGGTTAPVPAAVVPNSSPYQSTYPSDPPWLPPAGPPAACPPEWGCPPPGICVPDPRTDGFNFMCTLGNELCGGFNNEPCYEGKFCVRDPRMNCEGVGCSGICV